MENVSNSKNDDCISLVQIKSIITLWFIYLDTVVKEKGETMLNTEMQHDWYQKGKDKP
jgi:hypothetical protein